VIVCYEELAVNTELLNCLKKNTKISEPGRGSCSQTDLLLLAKSYFHGLT